MLICVSLQSCILLLACNVLDGLAMQGMRQSSASLYEAELSQLSANAHSGELIRTNADAKAETAWKFHHIAGSVPLICAGNTYTGPVEGVGFGAHGVVVALRRQSDEGRKVVAKVWRGVGGKSIIQRECDMLKVLQQRGVRNIVRCEASCFLNGHAMIVLTPFIEGNARGSGVGKPILEEEFDTPGAAETAIVNTVTTAWSMLQAGIVNADQGSNIFYSRDGVPTFFDMSLAEDLLKTDVELDGRGMLLSRKASSANHVESVKHFLGAVFQRIPHQWWKDGRAQRIFEKIGPPSTPRELIPAVNFTETFLNRYRAYSCRYGAVNSSSCAHGH